MNVTTLRVGTWNILGRRHDERSGIAVDGAVERTLAVHPVDVVCLQEVHFYHGRPDEQLCHELHASGLSNLVGSPLSPSHLDVRAELGVCIASRFPLRNPELHRLGNPGLRAHVRGNDWILHDKGLLGADLDIGSRYPVRVHSLHLFPFFEFGVRDDDRHVERMWKDLWCYVDSLSGADRVILAGDYNQVGRAEAAKLWSARSWNFTVPGGETTTRIGLSLDDIAINWTAPSAGACVVPTFSDHHLVIAEVAVLPEPAYPGLAAEARRRAQSRSPVR